MAKRATEARGDLRTLSSLAEVGQALCSVPELRAALERALEKLEELRGTVRAAVFLLDEESGELAVEAAVGISAEGLAARYKPGEGVVGRVVQSGRPRGSRDGARAAAAEPRLPAPRATPRPR